MESSMTGKRILLIGGAGFIGPPFGLHIVLRKERTAL